MKKKKIVFQRKKVKKITKKKKNRNKNLSKLKSKVKLVFFHTCTQKCKGKVPI
jgi:hypothetical protein